MYSQAPTLQCYTEPSNLHSEPPNQCATKCGDHVRRCDPAHGRGIPERSSVDSARTSDVPLVANWSPGLSSVGEGGAEIETKCSSLFIFASISGGLRSLGAPPQGAGLDMIALSRS